MTIKKFKQVRLGELAIQKFQDNTRTTFDAITDRQILDGILLKAVVLKTGKTNEIEHKLGRPPLGWFITRKRVTADIWDSQDSNVNISSTLNLECSADVTIDLWIF